MRNKKIVSIITIAMVGSLFLIGCNFRNEKEKIETKELLVLEEQKKAEEEKKKELEATTATVGGNLEGKKYSFDAKIVEDKLKKYDYSNNGEKVVFLTFDDGPSTNVTDKVLDVLDTHGVKGTFFVLGKTLDDSSTHETLKRVFSGGHAIANHTDTHNYKKLYPGKSVDVEYFVNDLKLAEDKMKKVLGEDFSTNVIRCPGGYMSWKGMDKLSKHLLDNDMASIDWNALNGDAEGKKRSSKELVEYAKKTSEGKEMVVLLMHDTNAKENTAEGLSEIIQFYKDNGYEFKTLR